MKHIIPNIQFRFSGLLILNILFSAIQYSGACERTYPREAEHSTSLVLYDFENTRIEIKDTGNYLFILRNNRNCHECLASMNNFIRLIKKTYGITTCVITLSDSITLERKRSCISSAKLFPDADIHCVQYTNQVDSNLFELYKTEFSPELLLVKENKRIHFSYRDIFLNATSDIRPAIQIAINRFFQKTR